MAEVGLDPVAVATMTAMRWADSTEPLEPSALQVSRLLLYPDLGHFGPQQDPARIAADIGEAWRSPLTREQPT